jgi:hypothetical protein
MLARLPSAAQVFWLDRIDDVELIDPDAGKSCTNFDSFPSQASTSTRARSLRRGPRSCIARPDVGGTIQEDYESHPIRRLDHCLMALQ